MRNLLGMFKQFAAFAKAKEHSASDRLLAIEDSEALDHASRSARVIGLALVVFGAWAYFGQLDEVTHGAGKVIPSSREQVIQSLEGGILAKLFVAEGDIVEANQVLAQLDPTINESNVEESAAKYRASLASEARLQAEVDLREIRFPEELLAYTELINSESHLYREKRRSLDESLSGLQAQLSLINRQLSITEPLAASGAASTVDVLQLKRQRAELEIKSAELKSNYMVQAREELAKAKAEVTMLSSTVRGRKDTLTRLTIKSPVRGVVKDIEVTTRGGVVPPNGKLLQIVPLDERLLIEAKIAPRDIAFIHPGQKSKVKITAYDYSIYGSLDGKVTTISPDTIQDKVKPDNYYYRVFIRTNADYVTNKAGKKMSIVPGMIATVDIKTGQKSILDYLIKPFNKVREALRER